MKLFSLTHFFASLAGLAFGATMATAQTPLAHWSFDEGVDDYSILSSADTTGGAVSDATWQEAGGAGLTYGVGQIGGAAYLDGASVAGHSFLVNVGTALTGPAFSISGWFQPAATQAGDAYKGIFMGRSTEDDSGTDQNWGLAWRDGDKIDGRASGQPNTSAAGSVVAGGGPNDGWYHLAMTWDGFASEHTIYINGVAANTDDNDALGIVNAGSFSIGQEPGSVSRHFRGAIDDFAIYSTVLSAGQITTIYNNGLGNGTTSTSANGTATLDIDPADVNRDGTVNSTDYLDLIGNMNTVATGRDDGDLNADGMVDLDDFAFWRNQAPPALLASLGFVPEPSSLMLLGLAGLFGLGSSRRRS